MKSVFRLSNSLHTPFESSVYTLQKRYGSSAMWLWDSVFRWVGSFLADPSSFIGHIVNSVTRILWFPLRSEIFPKTPTTILNEPLTPNHEVSSIKGLRRNQIGWEEDGILVILISRFLVSFVLGQIRRSGNFKIKIIRSNTWYWSVGGVFFFSLFLFISLKRS